MPEDGREADSNKNTSSDKNSEKQAAPAVAESAHETPSDNISKTTPVAKILILAVLVCLVVASLFLNIALLFSQGSQTNSSISGDSWIIIIGLMIIATTSLGISFWMYYMRAVYLKDGPALVPERWGSIIVRLVNASKMSDQSLRDVVTAMELQAAKSESLLESFLTLQIAISKRDDEIERLKRGYDSKIFKRFLMRFIRVSKTLSKIIEEEESDQVKNYKHLSRLMEDALEECGVEIYLPEIGSDYRDAGPQIAEDPTIVETHDRSRDFMISSVESSGYVIKGEEEIDVVVPAKVSIFRFSTNEGEC